MRVLWWRAPFVLRRHPPLLAAVTAAAALAAIAASAVPLMRAAVASESLKGQLRSMSPLAAGLELRRFGLVHGDAERRRAARTFDAGIASLGAPVVSTALPAYAVDSPGNGTVIVLARTGAAAHVQHLSGSGDDGVWIEQSTAKQLHLGPGGMLRLQRDGVGAPPTTVSIRVAGVFRDLDQDETNPYWANWLQDIRNPDPNSPPPPPLVLVPEATLLRIAPALSLGVANRFEFPVATRHLSLTSAKRLARRFATLERQAQTPPASLRALGCPCTAGSSLTAALAVAAGAVADVAPTISLLSACGLVIALGLAAAAGVFLVRRRADEANVLFARGESPAAFGLRTAIEALFPAALGAAVGLGVAILALRSFTPEGSIEADTVGAAAARAGAAGAAAIALVALGAMLAFPRRRTGRRWRIAVPWELAPLAVAAALLGLVVGGYGLTHDARGFARPRLAVFGLPVLAVAGVAGVGARAARRSLRGRAVHAPSAVFFAVRRLAAARGLLVAVVVAAAAAFGTFAYAATLSSSLDRSVAIKAYVANGSDVQGIVDPSERVTTPFPFPVAIAEIDQEDAFLPDGRPIDIVAADPQALARTLEFGRGWGGDPRPLLPRLERSSAGALAAIATQGAPGVRAVVDQGKRIPVHVVGHAAVPGATAGRPALLVSRAALRRAARRAGAIDPGPGAGGVVWAKGPPARVESALVASNLGPSYMTTRAHILEDGSVTAAKRSYRYVKLIAAAAAALALVALLLYLQARQRAQLIASALARRMGATAAGDAAALALEAASIMGFAALLGGVVATAAAAPVVVHVDAVPLYAPPPLLVVPYTTLVLGAIVAVAIAALLGALAAAIAMRSDPSEALRVA